MRISLIKKSQLYKWQPKGRVSYIQVYQELRLALKDYLPVSLLFFYLNWKSLFSTREYFPWFAIITIDTQIKYVWIKTYYIVFRRSCFRRRNDWWRMVGSLRGEQQAVTSRSAQAVHANFRGASNHLTANHTQKEKETISSRVSEDSLLSR